MSTQQVTICDFCGQRVDDIYNYPGWIRGGYDIQVILEKRKPSDEAGAVWAPNQKKDFCCLECFIKWLQNEVNAEANKQGIPLELSEWECTRL